jgi:hypothetical protein
MVWIKEKLKDDKFLLIGAACWFAVVGIILAKLPQDTATVRPNWTERASSPASTTRP